MDVRTIVAAASLLLAMPAGGPAGAPHGDPKPPGIVAGSTNDPAMVFGGSGLSGGKVSCSGDGVSGKRVQVIYVAVGRWVWNSRTRQATYVLTDRSASLDFRSFAADADAQFFQSAAETGGDRHLRFVTKPQGDGCELSVERMIVGPSVAIDWTKMTDALKSKGYTRTDRKYLVWVDINHPDYCGQALGANDDSHGSANANNSGPNIALVWCFKWSEAHELVHALGGVQNSAPNSTGHGHCTDEYDRMCYDDDGDGPVTMTYPCPVSHASLLDCNHDDFFHTAPADGSYLATHWNLADSAFLIKPLWYPTKQL